VKTRWIKHLKDQEAKDRFASLLANHLHSDPVFKRLLEIIAEMKGDIEKNTYSLESVNSNPNWALRQAFNVGALNTLKELEDLFELTKKETRPNVARSSRPVQRRQHSS
jgi:hypothetical protein